MWEHLVLLRCLCCISCFLRLFWMFFFDLWNVIRKTHHMSCATMSHPCTLWICLRPCQRFLCHRACMLGSWRGCFTATALSLHATVSAHGSAPLYSRHTRFLLYFFFLQYIYIFLFKLVHFPLLLDSYYFHSQNRSLTTTALRLLQIQIYFLVFDLIFYSSYRRKGSCM